MLIIDEFNFVANTTTVLGTMANYGRALIALSSTHGIPNTHNNPLPAMSIAPTDINGHPTLRAVFVRRCPACARMRRRFCPHMPFSVPWQRHRDAGDQEHDVDLIGPVGPLLSSKARALMVSADVGREMRFAPVVIGIDPGGGRSATAGVALRLHERGAAIVGLLASTREAGQHLEDAVQFIADTADMHGLGRRVVVYIENNLGAAAATIVSGVLAARRKNVVIAREPGQPVAGFTTAEKTKMWFADMLHTWIELAPSLHIQPMPGCTIRVGDGRKEPRTHDTLGAYEDACRMLADHLGNVQRGAHGPVFKRGEEHAGNDDLFFALGMALRMLVMASPDYAGAYSAHPGLPPGARITGFRVVAPSDMANLYAQNEERFT